jgi:hypothetical protein
VQGRLGTIERVKVNPRRASIKERAALGGCESDARFEGSVPIVARLS